MEEGRTKKAVRNIFFNVTNQLLTLILAFVSRTVFIWGFGIEYLGLNGLFNDVLGLLSMADLGFGTAMVYSFYKPLADKDYEKMAALVTFYKKIYQIIAIAVTVLGGALIPVLPKLINLERDIPHVIIYYLIALANVVFSYLCVYRTSILNADQKNYKVTKISMITNIVKTIMQIIVIIVYKNYILYLLIGTATVLINNILTSYVATKEYPFIKRHVKLLEEDKKQIFNNIGSMFLYKIAAVFLNTTDNILISVLIGTIIVGYYSNYLMLQNKITLIYSLIFTSLTASIGNLIVNESAEKRYEIYKCEQAVSYIISGIVIPCYIILVNDLIKIWLGKEFLLDIHVIYAIGANMYLTCVMQPLWSYREATGLYRQTKWIMIVCAILNIILSVILGKCMGLAGIIIASVLSRILTYVWYEPRLLFQKYFEENPRAYFQKLVLNCILIIALTSILQFCVKNIVIENFVGWTLKAALSGGICLITVGILYLPSEDLRFLVRKISLYTKRK